MNTASSAERPCWPSSRTAWTRGLALTAAGIIVEHCHRATRLVRAIERDHPAEPDEARVIVAQVDRLLADVGARREHVAEVAGDAERRRPLAILRGVVRESQEQVVEAVRIRRRIEELVLSGGEVAGRLLKAVAAQVAR